MTVVPMPVSAADLGRTWLAGALRSQGFSGFEIDRVGYEDIKSQHGVLDRFGRLRVDYTRNDAQLPRRFFVKRPPESIDQRFAASCMRVYEREVAFYQNLGNATVLRPPAHYYSDVDTIANRYVLLLEDLGDVRWGDLAAGADLDDALIALRALGRQHAKFWCDPTLDDQPWLTKGGSGVENVAMVAHKAKPIFLQSFGHHLPSVIRDGLDEAIAFAKPVFNHLAGLRFWTLSHGDFHIGNMAFDDCGVRVFDWQAASQGFYAQDLRHFINVSVRQEIRRAHLSDLLEAYHDELVAAGIETLTKQDIRDHYHYDCVLSWGMMVMLAGGLFVDKDKTNNLVNAFLPRFASALVDADVPAVLRRLKADIRV